MSYTKVKTLEMTRSWWYTLVVKIDEKAKAAIEAALNRGSNVELKRKGNGVVVSEVKKQIKYSTSPMGER